MLRSTKKARTRIVALSSALAFKVVVTGSVTVTVVGGSVTVVQSAWQQCLTNDIERSFRVGGPPATRRGARSADYAWCYLSLGRFGIGCGLDWRAVLDINVAQRHRLWQCRWLQVLKLLLTKITDYGL